MCGYLQQILESKGDCEKKLETLGKDIGMKFLEIYEIRRSNKIVDILESITYTFLPKIYTSNRYVEKSKDFENVFLIIEDTPFFGKYISAPKRCEGFCADSITGGIISVVLTSFGYKNTVTACLSPSKNILTKVVYVIKINTEDLQREKRYS
ncbi:subunit of transport protein particle complex [Hamiltosporidium tvaerminnensis]|uniref:Subunit of transport protein particle complex n=2 Tax=Hamiltosporidium tvaerminnensis TaxID=1176355 RepID=A0A4V2JUJ5_9MICR|nr:subunit of transport protein particle complex [Hamiltosporidium tvaerminnensis]